MRWSIFHFKSSRFCCMSRRTWVCAGEAACGTTSQKSDVTVQPPRSGLSTQSRLRFLHDRSRSCDRSSENTLLPPYHNHVKRNSNSNQPRGSVAIDSEPDQLDEYLISRAKRVPAGPPGAVFFPLEPQRTRSERVASSEGCR